MDASELAEAYKASGNNTDLLALWDGVRKFAYKVMRPYSGTLEVSDMEQEAFMALYDAVPGYDASKAGFLTYYLYFLQSRFESMCACSGAARVPVSRMLDVRRKDKSDAKADSQDGTETAVRNASRAVSMQMTMAGTDGITIADTIADPDNVIDECVNNMEIEELKRVLWGEVDKLPSDCARRIRQHFQDGKTLTQIAAEEGKPVSTVQRSYSNGMQRLQRKRSRIRPFVPEWWNVFTGGSRWTSAEEKYVLMLENRGLI